MSPRDVPWYPSASKARAAPSRMADRVTSARSCLTMRPTPACVATSSRDQFAFPPHKKTNRMVLFLMDQGTTLETKGVGVADRIRVGVVGAHAERGWGRNIHLPALRALNDFEVTAVAGTTAASARAAAEVWGAERSYDDAR